MMKKLLLSFIVVLTFNTSNAQVIFSENFDTFANLATNGWVQTNQSNPVGASTWAQGGGTAFAPGAYNGAATSFTLCNFNSTTGAGIISNWLITPVISVQNGDVISFYTRTGGSATAAAIYPDNLELRMSTNGAFTANPSTGDADVADFTNLLVEINPGYTTSDYPFTWTQYSYTVTGLSGLTDVKLGFRYYVPDGGPSGANSNIIGVDAFAVTRPVASTQSFFAGNFSIQPNPVNDVFNLTTKNGIEVQNVQVLDVNGRVVNETKGSKTETTQVNVSDLNSGVYFVKVQSDSGVGTSKIIKK